MNAFIRLHRHLYLWLWRGFGAMALVVGTAFLANVVQTLVGATGPFDAPLPRGDLAEFTIIGMLAILIGFWVLRRKPLGWTVIYPDA